MQNGESTPDKAYRFCFYTLGASRLSYEETQVSFLEEKIPCGKRDPADNQP